MRKYCLFLLLLLINLNCIAQSSLGFFGGIGKTRIYRIPFGSDIEEYTQPSGESINTGVNFTTNLDEKTEIYFDLFYQYYSLDIMIDKINTHASHSRRNESYSLPQLGLGGGYCFSLYAKNIFQLLLPLGFNLNYFFNSRFSGISYKTIALPVTTPDSTTYYVFIDEKIE